VRYEIDGELLGPVGHCHCWRCRKHSGASFGTTAAVKSDELRFTKGEEQLRSWESSPGIQRFFAGCCGSPLFKRHDAMPELLGFRLGTLDSDPGRTVEQHIMVTGKAPWIRLDDGLPRKPGGAPFPERD
jgi:hypothetical protein